jgi:hypothetical protein
MDCHRRAVLAQLPSPLAEPVDQLLAWRADQDRAVVWNQRHLMTVLREYEGFYKTHRPHRTSKRAAPLRPQPEAVTDFDQFRVQRRDRAGGVIHEYRLVA